ncbi:Thioredoxin family protein [Giardia muris]|uniref:Thioredoxin family protein n=1 Tax=Giardia muris TaxID=5742 RepID=A0A4Z1T1I3_GIAMU|nr:Thioredoxin family protein [Giardia muris]|eukprot:TNJ26399.1 Thioredoxin family protein [Giardia muris]
MFICILTAALALPTVTHDELVALPGDTISIYWDSKDANATVRDVIDSLNSVSDEMVARGLHPIMLVDKQDERNVAPFTLPELKELPFLVVHLATANVTEGMLAPFTIENVVHFLMERIQANPLDLRSIPSEEDLLDIYEEGGRRPTLLFFRSRTCTTCASVRIFVERVATLMRETSDVFEVDCDETLEKTHFCSRMQIRGFPYIALLHEDVFTVYNGTISTVELLEWTRSQIMDISSEERRKEWRGRSNEIFNSEYYEEAGKNAYDAKGRPKEWPMKPNIRRTQQKVTELEKRVAIIEELMGALVEMD